MGLHFVGEPIRIIASAVDMAGAAIGEPGLPRRFVWRGEEYEVDGLIAKWKELSGCRSGADERYVRKHWFHVHATDGSEMKFYLERQARSKRERKTRWWLFSRITPEE